MINFKKKTRLKQAAKAFENQLSRNEWILYMHFIANCNSHTLSCEISLRKLHDELKMAINTIKACRNSLKKYGLIDFSREQYATTCYEIRDLLQNPINELPQKQNTEIAKSAPAEKQKAYIDFNYDFVDEDLRASFILFIKHLIENENISMDQDKAKRIYQNYMEVFNADEFKEHVASQIVQDERIKCMEAYNLTHIDLSLKEIMEDIIWQHSRAQAPLSQREVDNIYMQVYINCEGNIERMQIMLNELLKTI